MIAEPHTVRRAVLVMFGLFILLGLPEGVLGTSWPSIRTDFGRGDASFGWLIAGYTLGYTGSSVVSGHLAETIGLSRFFTAATATAALGHLTLGWSPTWWIVVLGMFVLGWGAGSVDSGANAWMALSHGTGPMHLLHGFFGLGATVGPLLATGLLNLDQSWRTAYLLLAGLQLVAVLAVTGARTGIDHPPDFHRSEDDRPEPPGRTDGNLMPLMLLWFVFYVGTEVGLGQWAFTLLTDGRSMDATAAGLVVSGYWGGLMVGRFGLGFAGDRFRAERVLDVSLVVAGAAIAWAWLDPGGIGFVALPVTGGALASMFPLMVNRTPVYLGPERSRRVVGYQLASSSVGAMAIPGAIGVLAERHGVEAATMPVVAACAVTMAALWWAIRSRAVPVTGATQP